MELKEIHKKILGYCAYDDMGLWVVVIYASEDQYSFDMVPEWVRQKTIKVVRDLLESGLIEAGNPNGPTFRTLAASVADTIKYIEGEWDKLDKAPGLGDICWFRATPAGERLAHELGLRA